MQHKDYIVRQLEEFGKVLGVLLFLKKEKDWSGVEKELAVAAQKFTPFEMEYLESLNEEDFLKEVINKQNISLDQKKVLAALLFEKMEVYSAIAFDQNYYDTAKKCLVIYNYLKSNQTQNEFNLEVHYRLEFLKKVLGD